MILEMIKAALENRQSANMDVGILETGFTSSKAAVSMLVMKC